MNGSTIVEIVITLALIIANGFFAASEIALVSARRGRLEQQARAGSRGAKQAIALSENSDRFLATVQVGVTFIGTVASAFGGARISASLAVPLSQAPVIGPYADVVAFTIVVLLITYFTLVLGELVPKRLGLNHAEQVAARMAPTMIRISRLTGPIIALLTGSVNFVLRLLGQAGPRESEVTEEDIVYLTQTGAATGTVEAGEEQFIRRVFRFTDQRVEEVMTPRPDIVAVRATLSVEEARRVAVTSGHSHLPVYGENLDDMLGVLVANDLLRALGPEATPTTLTELARPAIFVPERKPIDEVLAAFRKQGAHMAIAIDEYGQVTGLVTIKDVIEELIGEFHTPTDEGGEEEIKQLKDGSWLVDGSVSYQTARDLIGLPPVPEEEEGEYNTIGGLVLTRLMRVPRAGDSVADGHFTIEVMDMDGRRVDKVRVSQRAPTPHPGAEDATHRGLV